MPSPTAALPALLVALLALRAIASDDDTIHVQSSNHDYDTRQFDTADKLVVWHDELVRAGDAELTDALKRLPGILISNTGEIRLRGLASGYTQVLVNGDKMPQGFSLDSLPPDMVDHVEIIRTASADGSGQAIAGTINVVLKHRAKPNQHRLMTALAGGAGLLNPSTGVNLSNRDDMLNWSLDGNVSYKDTHLSNEEVDTANDERGIPTLLRYRNTTKSTQATSLSLTPSLQITTGDIGPITVESFIKADHAAYLLNTVSPTTLGADELRYDDVQRNRNNQLITRTDISWTVPMANTDKLDLKFELSTAKRSTTFREQGSDMAGVPNLDTVVFSHAAEQGLTWSGKYIAASLGAHTVSAGWQAAITHRAETRDEYAEGFPGIAPIDSTDIYQSSMRSYALFVQDEWQATEGLSLYGGLRWEWLQTHSSGDTFNTVDYAINTPCPTLQGTWKLSDTGKEQLRFALARSYNVPAINKLVPRVYTSIFNSSVDPDFQGNPRLRPETGFGPDLAYEFFPADGVSVSLGGYARRIQNYVREDVTLINGRWVMQPINAGGAGTRGLEMDSKLPLRLLADGWSSWVLSANITRNWSRVDGVPAPGNRVENQTPWSGTVTADYVAANGSYGAGFSYSYTSGGWMRTAPSSFADGERRDDVSAYALWKPAQGAQLRLSASNLLHQRTADLSGYQDANGTLTSTLFTPTHASVRLAFELAF